MSAQKTKPTNYRPDSKAEKLKTAVEKVFQGHASKFGSKTLTSIAFSFASGQR